MSIEDKIRNELKSVGEQVRYLLEKYPETRNSDTYLEYLWMRYFKNISLPWLEYQKLQEFSLETVRRNRQKIQALGLFEPTNEETKIRRKIKERVYRQEFSPSKRDNWMDAPDSL